MLLPPGQTSNVCPYCASAALVAAPEEAELLPPQGVIPMRLDGEAAQRQVRAWLRRGLLAPDDLALLARGGGLAPVYVPFWSFNATQASRWRARVEVNEGGKQRTLWHEGEETQFHTHWLQPGTRALPGDLLREIEPFEMKQLVVHKPEYLAGWPAGTYDVSLAQASLNVRAAMVEAATRRLWQKALPGRLVTDLEVTGTDFTGQTYQLVLLPVWVGNYHYRGRAFRVLVNGQTGKAAGDKPVDTVKVALLALIGLVVAVFGGLAFWLWLTR
jgi:hypothetical protein